MVYARSNLSHETTTDAMFRRDCNRHHGGKRSLTLVASCYQESDSIAQERSRGQRMDKSVHEVENFRVVVASNRTSRLWCIKSDSGNFLPTYLLSWSLSSGGLAGSLLWV